MRHSSNSYNSNKKFGSYKNSFNCGYDSKNYSRNSKNISNWNSNCKNSNSSKKSNSSSNNNNPLTSCLATLTSSLGSFRTVILVEASGKPPAKTTDVNRKWTERPEVHSVVWLETSKVRTQVGGSLLVRWQEAEEDMISRLKRYIGEKG